ncbi:copper resistance protein CopC [Pseudoclavibacter sp. CFCC 13796]|nr:copper resistance protein CopC [Pseudoclavibacter sp. CFCC 13796]
MRHRFSELRRKTHSMHNQFIAPARTRTTLTAAIALLVGLLLTLQPWATGRAHAHDVLVSSDPAAGAALTTAPTQVALTFNNDVLTGVANQIQVHGPDGASVAGDGLAAVEGRVVTVPVTSTANGTYSVAWHVVSSDGHPVEGTFTFDLASPDAPAADETPDASGQASASSASAAPSASAEAQADGQSDDVDHSGAIVAWVITGIVVVIGVAAIVLGVRRSRRTKK